MRWITWRLLDGWRDVGLVLLRGGLGLSMMVHGWPKLMGGPDKWAGLGGVMEVVGITFAPTFWGFAAAVAEFVGGLLVVPGLATRPAALSIAFTMAIAVLMHGSNGDGFRVYSHALETGIGFLAIVVLGPGRFAIDPNLKGG